MSYLEELFSGPPASYRKAIVSAFMAVLLILETFFNVTIEGFDETWITTALAVLWPVLVLLIPNRMPSPNQLGQGPGSR